MASAGHSRSTLLTASHSAKLTFQRALSSCHDALVSLENLRRKAEDVGRFFLLFRPIELEGFETAGHETLKHFVTVLYAHKYRVMFEVPKGSAEPKEYRNTTQLRLQWVFDEIEEYTEPKSPLRHAYTAFTNTFRKAITVYATELEFIESQRKRAEADGRFSFSITLGNVGELGNSDEKKIIGFILLMKAHGYGVKYILQDGEEPPSTYSSDTRLLMEMIPT